MKKRMGLLIFILAFALLMCIPVSATSRATAVTPSLSFSGSTANCRVTIYEPGKEIDVVLELWYGNTLVDSWSNTGLSYVAIREDCAVVSGRMYVLKASGSIDGVVFTSLPISARCP